MKYYSKNDLLKMYLAWVTIYGCSMSKLASDRQIDFNTAVSCVNRGRVLHDANVIDIKSSFTK